MAKKFRDTIEDTYYSLLKVIMQKSQLGKNCVEGRAETGYNFDHMYTAEPQGEGFFGKMIDYILLNLPATKATRGRKETIKGLVKQILLERKSTQTTIVDIASGPSRYLLEAIEDVNRNGNYDVTLIDRDTKSLRLAEKLATRKNISCHLEFLQGDVFDKTVLGKLKMPDLVISSGLYVYVPEDERVDKSLRDIAQIMSPDGKLIVDNQVNNPNKQLIEKLGKTTKGESWKLVYRSEKDMNDLVSRYFEVLGSLVDRWNMYHIILGGNRNGRPS